MLVLGLVLPWWGLVRGLGLGVRVSVRVRLSERVGVSSPTLVGLGQRWLGCQ